MRKSVLAAGLAVAALLPSIALAATTCEERNHNNRVTGTVVGAGLGALLGSAVAGHGHKGDGAIVGGLGGALVGNQAAQGKADCDHAYGYYDSDGTWRANAYRSAEPQGYFDRDGHWVQGQPHGYYRDGRWVEGSANGAWRGDHWEEPNNVPAAYGRPEGAYGRPDGDNRRDLASREAWLDQQIQAGSRNGSLSRWDARRAQRTLRDIRQDEMAERRRDGRLSDRDEARYQARLDELSRQIRVARD